MSRLGPWAKDLAERVPGNSETATATTIQGGQDDLDRPGETCSVRHSKANGSMPPLPSARRLPPGPSKTLIAFEDLFHWMVENFDRFGDIYKASVFGSNVYVISNPEYCEQILRWNWRNYERKGQIVKRIALLLGNGLIASNGEFWASHRRMIQPAFSKQSISGLTGMITRINAELLDAWRQAADRQATVNVTHDLRVCP